MPSRHETVHGPVNEARRGRCRRSSPAGCPGVSTTLTTGSMPGELADVGAPLLHADGLVARPVHDGGGHRRGVEQRLGLGVDVVLVDGRVHARVPAGGDLAAAEQGVDVLGGQATVAAVARVHPGDGDGQVEEPGTGAGHGLLGDLRHRVRRRVGGVDLAQRVGLEVDVHRVVVRAGTSSASTSRARPWPCGCGPAAGPCPRRWPGWRRRSPSPAPSSAAKWMT